MNFNPMRLLRRTDHIDDTATAYIEGRATERDEAELLARQARDPGLQDDLESIRETVALLRSMDQVAAPRSFALTHAPVQVRRESRPRLAIAPAVFALAAAAIVGLLAVGNLANVVHQNDGTASSRVTISESDDQSAAAFAPEIASGSQESTALSGASGTQADAERSTATETTNRPVQPTGTPAPAGTSSPPATLPFVPAGPPLSGVEDPDTGMLLVPPATDAATAETSSKNDGEGQLAPPTGNLETPIPFNDGSVTAIPGEPGSTETEPQLPLPRPTAAIQPDFPGETNLLGVESLGDQGNLAGQRGQSEQDGISVPLWQLQTGFAVFAVLMAGAWMLLQRRLTS